LIACALVFGHGCTTRIGSGGRLATDRCGVIAGFAIGIVAAVMGVAGGELLVPTLMLPYGADIKLAGSLSFLQLQPFAAIE
jgi:uncharacterized protein